MAKAKTDDKKAPSTKSGTKVRILSSADAEKKPIRKKSSNKAKTTIKNSKRSAISPSSKTKKKSDAEEPKGLESKASDKPSLDDRIKAYFVGSVHEIRKVVWPGRKESWNLTISVLVFSSIFAAFTTVVDYGVVQALEKFVLGK